MPLSNTRAMDQIHLLLQGLTPENNDDVLSEIIQITRDTGREITGADPSDEYLLLNMVDNHVAWSATDNIWLDVSRGTIFTSRDLTMPEVLNREGTSFFFPVSEYQNLSDRARSNLRAGLYGITQASDAIHSWEWINPDDRELPEMRIAVTWATTPSNPSSLTIQYTYAELNQLRLELARTRLVRADRERLREQWGHQVGDRLARREAQRSVAIPANRRDGMWTFHNDFDPDLQNPAFYEQGTDECVLAVRDDTGTSYGVSRHGHAMARDLSDEHQIREPHEFREQFPDGNITWDLYDAPYFAVNRFDENGDLGDDVDAETYYTLTEAANRAAQLLRVRPLDFTTLNQEEAA